VDTVYILCHDFVQRLTSPLQFIGKANPTHSFHSNAKEANLLLGRSILLVSRLHTYEIYRHLHTNITANWHERTNSHTTELSHL